MQNLKSVSIDTYVRIKRSEGPKTSLQQAFSSSKCKRPKTEIIIVVIITISKCVGGKNALDSSCRLSFIRVQKSPHK